MATVFTKIIQGEIPSYKIYEDELCFAFLDIRPMHTGHTLLIPKQEINHLDDVDETTYVHLFLVAKKISKAIKQVTSCARVGILVEGMEVPHAHIHIVPINKPGDLSFTHSKELPQSDMEDIHKRLFTNLN